MEQLHRNKGASENNLKGFNVKFPLNVLTVVTGVSGFGKVIAGKKYPVPGPEQNYMEGPGRKRENSDCFAGICGYFRVEMIDQNPIGKSSRSNPVTYIKAYDEIRKLFAEQTASKLNGFQPVISHSMLTAADVKSARGKA
jgi:excinuclease ABC subunit A